ncbi:MAG: hypothetical protein Kow00105_14360 [Phycisphaeraceae bacterium]
MTVTPSSADSPQTITFTGVPGAPNGAWCWYQDERVVVDTRHPDGPMLLLGTVSFSKTDPAEHGDSGLHVDIEVNSSTLGLIITIKPTPALCPLEWGALLG